MLALIWGRLPEILLKSFLLFNTLKIKVLARTERKSMLIITRVIISLLKKLISPPRRALKTVLMISIYTRL